MEIQSIYRRMRSLVPREKGSILQPILAGLVAFIYYGALLLQGNWLIDSDAYYHVRIAELYARNGWIYRLPWMAETTAALRFVDIHFLFHWAQVPFIWIFRDTILVARLSTVLFASFSVALLMLLLERLRVRRKWLWVIFYLMASPVFTGRLLFGRGSTLFLGILFLFILYIYEKRHKRIAVLSFLAVWTYPGFPLFFLIAFLFTLSEYSREKRLDPALLLWTIGGILAGILIHPGFPGQFQAYWTEFVVQFQPPAQLERIGEWMPASGDVIRVALALPVFLLLYRILSGGNGNGEGELDSRPILVLSLGIFFSLFFAIKTIEYLIPFVTIFLALQEKEETSSGLDRVAFAILMASIITWAVPQTFAGMTQQFQITDPAQKFDAASWLKANSEMGDRVLLSWEDFPEFFYADAQNVYPFGLNPAYAWSRDQDRYLLIRSFFEGRLANPAMAAVALHYRFAVIGKQWHMRTISLLLQDRGNCHLVYENGQYVIFQFTHSDP